MISRLKKTIPAALFAGLLLSTPLFATAQDGPPPPGESGSGPGGHDPQGHHGGGPFMHELRQLGLSDAQRETIRGYVEAAHAQGQAEHESMRSLHRAFETTAPNSAGYDTVVAQMADAAANAARAHVQKMAALRAQIYSALTDAQKAKLASELASLPEPPARSR